MSTISSFIYEVSIRVIVFTVLAFSQQILKLGLKMRSSSNSTFPGLLKNVLTSSSYLFLQVVFLHSVHLGHVKPFNAYKRISVCRIKVSDLIISKTRYNNV